ncbi:MAG: metal-dependent hydrolase [Meiothermus silvanus]|nr:metal-dependent hydrolase [Allomeiothermus silvanus]
MLELRYLGHSAVYLSDGKTRIVVDPFLSGNPTASLKAEELEVDYVLVTHAHGDHWGDSLALAQKGATIIGTAEIGYYAESKGAKAIPMNIGGKLKAAWGSLKLTPAWHSSSFPDGTYGGMPTGMILEFGGMKIYHAGDTALFSDMGLIGKHGIDLACLPIGDHFTMGPDDALQALELIRPKAVLPIHYNTFPPIMQDGEAFVARARLLGVEGRALKPGEVWPL